MARKTKKAVPISRDGFRSSASPSHLLSDLATSSHFIRRLRMIPITSISPVPTSSNVAGSGTGPDGLAVTTTLFPPTIAAVQLLT